MAVPLDSKYKLPTLAAVVMAELTVRLPEAVLPILVVPAVMRASSAAETPKVFGKPIVTSAPPTSTKVVAVRFWMVTVPEPALTVALVSPE